MKFILYLSSITFLLILAFSCAKQTSPTGGPKDSIPPNLIKAIPANKTINFTGNSIQLIFDENIQLNNPREQLLITPSIEKDFEMTAKKRNVTLKFKRNLQDSTTYTINFRESIQDINEKNPAKNLQLAISTGSYIDSLSISGTVQHILSGKKADDASIALYNNIDTFNIFKDKPTYLTKTNQDGEYTISNLKSGTYYIYAFNDKNKNIIVDSKSEAYGFLKKPIYLKPDSVFKIDIPILTMDSKELKLISGRPYNTYFNIKFSKNIKDFNITQTDTINSTDFYQTFGDDFANIKIYTPQLEEDSIRINLKAYDSLGSKVDTTLYVKSNPRKTTPEKLSLKIENSKIIADEAVLKSTLKFNKPILSINFDSITYKYDSTTEFSLHPENFSLTEKKNELNLSLALDKSLFKKETEQQGFSKSVSQPKNIINKLVFGKSAFISIENDSTTFKEENVNILTSTSTGTILVETNITENKSIIQIITTDLKVVQTVKAQKTTFKNIPPGNYLIRLIIDENENGEWDPGNFNNKEEPEKIYFYKNEEGQSQITVKANWELGPLLITSSYDVDK